MDSAPQQHLAGGGILRLCPAIGDQIVGRLLTAGITTAGYGIYGKFIRVHPTTSQGFRHIGSGDPPCFTIEAEEFVQVRTEIDRKRTMGDAATLTEDVRTAATALIRREEYRVHSRMLAYENVASMVGASSSWLRKFVNGYAEVSLSFPVGMNIIALYRRLCERVERKAQILEEKNAASMCALATIESDLEFAARSTEAETHTTDGDAI